MWFIRWVYQELRQSFIDMEAMFELRDTKPSVVDSSGAVEYVPSRDGTQIEFVNTGFAYKTSPPSPAYKDPLSDGATHHAAHEEELIGSRPILKGTTFTIPQGATIAIGKCICSGAVNCFLTAGNLKSHIYVVYSWKLWMWKVHSSPNALSLLQP
jgi:ABC-type multidrug transport system fused ATPase/permease subunit